MHDNALAVDAIARHAQHLLQQMVFELRVCVSSSLQIAWQASLAI